MEPPKRRSVLFGGSGMTLARKVREAVMSKGSAHEKIREVVRILNEEVNELMFAIKVDDVVAVIPAVYGEEEVWVGFVLRGACKMLVVAIKGNIIENIWWTSRWP